MTTGQSAQTIRDIETTLQQHMNLFGYKLIEMPIIADADIFLTRAGNSIVEQLFTFERFGRLLALRPEFTALLANQYTQDAHTDPVRWQLSGSIFIDEPSNYSMQYQQHNIGAEFIGEKSSLADAEVMAMAVSGIEKLKIKDWQLVVGHVGLQLHLLAQFGLDSRTQRILLTQRDRLKQDGKEAVLDYLSNILIVGDEQAKKSHANGQETQQMLDMLLDSTRYTSTMGGRTRHDIAGRIMQKHDRGLEQERISQALDFLQNWGNVRGTLDDAINTIKPFIADNDEYGKTLLDNWLEVLHMVTNYGINTSQIIIQPDLTKNWDYYTGFVFGIRTNKTYVASGGRYDGLTRLLGSDQEIPAVGFAYYTQPLTEAIPSATKHSDLPSISSDDVSVAIQWAQDLRSNGIAVEVVSEKGDIVATVDGAQYKNKSFTREQLKQELKQ